MAKARSVSPLHVGKGWTRRLGLLELVIGGLIAAAAVALHGWQRSAAGGLWRDEATSIQVANMPTPADTWRYLEFDSYPILYHLLLRSWSGGFGDGDGSLRILGFLIGLILLGAVWLSVRAAGVRVPLCSLALLGLNPLVIRYGDSTRAYGIGCVLAVTAAAAVWRAAQTERVEWRRFVPAAAAGIISVQCLYHNAALLLASCLGAAVVALLQRRPKVAGAVLATGIPAAISLLPYLPTIHRTGQWSILFRFPVTLPWLWERVSEVTGAPGPLGTVVWTVLLFATLGLAAWRLAEGRRYPTRADASVRTQAAAAFTLLIGLAVYAVFLAVVGYVTQPWYYLAVLSLAAVCFDAVLGQPREVVARAARLVLAAGFALYTFPAARAQLTVRSTNVDLVAQQLNALVKPNDLVVVAQWERAISLNRYYHGPAPLATVPLLDDHAVHRYDLILKALQTPEPLAPVFAAMERTLRGGGHLWLVGVAEFPEPGQRVPTLPPDRPDAAGDWHAPKYYVNWWTQLGQFLEAHGTTAAAHPVSPAAGSVSDYESEPLTEISGWQ